MRKPTDEKAAELAKLIAEYWQWNLKQVGHPIGTQEWLYAQHLKSKLFGRALELTGLSMARLEDCFNSRVTWTELYNRKLMQ